MPLFLTRRWLVPPERSDRAGPKIFLLLVCVYFVTFGGHFYSGDGIEMARTAESLVLRGDIALQRAEGERDWGYAGRDGRHYAPYPLGQSLAEAPLVGMGAALTGPLPLDDHLKMRLRHAAALSTNVFITAAIGWVLYRFSRRLGYRVRLSAALALMAGLGTMLWVYARHDFGDPLSTLALLGGALLLRRWADTGSRRDIVASGVCLGFSLFTKYQMVVYCPVLWVYLILLRRERGERDFAGLARDTLLLALPVVLFGLADLGVNWIKFGSLTSTGYEQEASPWAGLSHIPIGLHGFLLSPGKSVLLYNPLLFLWPFSIVPFHRAHRSESLLGLVALGATLLFFSPLYWWHGDWAWGPRYLLPVIPLLVLGMAPAAQAACRSGALRRVFVLLLVMTLGINLLGMTVNFFFYLRSLSSMGRMHDDWNFIPGLSPVVFHAHVVWSDLSELTTGQPRDFVYRAWRDGKFSDTVITMADYAREGKIPDFFFFKPYDTRIEQWTLGAAGLVWIVLGVAAARLLRRELAAAEAPA